MARSKPRAEYVLVRKEPLRRRRIDDATVTGLAQWVRVPMHPSFPSRRAAKLAHMADLCEYPPRSAENAIAQFDAWARNWGHVKVMSTRQLATAQPFAY